MPKYFDFLMPIHPEPPAERIGKTVEVLHLSRVGRQTRSRRLRTELDGENS